MHITVTNFSTLKSAHLLSLEHHTRELSSSASLLKVFSWLSVEGQLQNRQLEYSKLHKNNTAGTEAVPCTGLPETLNSYSRVVCAEILSESNVCELPCLWKRQGSLSGVEPPIPLTSLSHPAVPHLAHGFTGDAVIKIFHSSFHVSP